MSDGLEMEVLRLGMGASIEWQRARILVGDDPSVAENQNPSEACQSRKSVRDQDKGYSGKTMLNISEYELFGMSIKARSRFIQD